MLPQQGVDRGHDEKGRYEQHSEEEGGDGRARGGRRFLARSFRQAVQWLPRGAVSVPQGAGCCCSSSDVAPAAVDSPPPEEIALLASRDTYDIKFSPVLPGRGRGGGDGEPAGLVVPRAAAAAHSPVASREAAEAAKAVGARPRSRSREWVLPDAAAAAGVCGRLFM